MTLTFTRDACPGTLKQPQEKTFLTSGQKRDFHKTQNISMSPVSHKISLFENLPPVPLVHPVTCGQGVCLVRSECQQLLLLGLC